MVMKRRNTTCRMAIRRRAFRMRMKMIRISMIGRESAGRARTKVALMTRTRINQMKMTTMVLMGAK